MSDNLKVVLTLPPNDDYSFSTVSPLMPCTHHTFLDLLQHSVSGYITVLPTEYISSSVLLQKPADPNKNWVLVVDEEGALKGHPPNKFSNNQLYGSIVLCFENKQTLELEPFNIGDMDLIKFLDF